MSGAEVLGLISSIMTIIEVSVKLYEAAGDASGLPQGFHDVAARLPLIQDTLETAQADLASPHPLTNDDGVSLSSRTALIKVLKSCRKKTEALNKIFRAVLPVSGASRVERYYTALKTIPRGSKVEYLMAGILGDLQVISSNQAIKAATRAQMERLISAVSARAGASLGTADTDDSGGNSRRSASHSRVIAHNLGPGNQFFNAGTGDQYNSIGNGVQVAGSPGGTFYFGRMT